MHTASLALVVRQDRFTTVVATGISKLNKSKGVYVRTVEFLIIIMVPLEATHRRDLAVLLFPVRYVYRLVLPLLPTPQSGPGVPLYIPPQSSQSKSGPSVPALRTVKPPVFFFSDLASELVHILYSYPLI
ncbi:hypothetical protein M404DRAFT_805069 [Pisolithus tinctorius Marx 270]|uniref:Uncharacterized protein n=1 Tax=Pisolithus tinctorius Marx 270 TaxID=870435 RepID=A0A0C3JRZ0_PISTI|nr:hypothetical protein M404DRAFT_805069 [Pisolithus tinctorius Marx 270]